MAMMMVMVVVMTKVIVMPAGAGKCLIIVYVACLCRALFLSSAARRRGLPRRSVAELLLHIYIHGRRGLPRRSESAEACLGDFID